MCRIAHTNDQSFISMAMPLFLVILMQLSALASIAVLEADLQQP